MIDEDTDDTEEYIFNLLPGKEFFVIYIEDTDLKCYANNMCSHGARQICYKAYMFLLRLHIKDFFRKFILWN